MKEVYSIKFIITNRKEDRSYEKGGEWIRSTLEKIQDESLLSKGKGKTKVCTYAYKSVIELRTL